MVQKTNDLPNEEEFLDEEEKEWQEKHPLGSFEDTSYGWYAVPIDISDIPPELQEIAREVKERCDREAKKNK